MSGRINILWLLIVALMVSMSFAACEQDDDEDGKTVCKDDDDDDDDNDDNDDNNDDSTDPPFSDFSVGFSKRDISPDHPVKMAGYGSAFLLESWCRWSTGIHDPIWARAAAFEDGDGDAVIMIVMDNVGTITNEIVKIQTGISKKLDIPEKSIVVAATHNHHGPDTIGLWGLIIPPQTGRDDVYLEWMVQQAIDTGIGAFEARVPAVLEYAVGEDSRFHQNKIILDPNRKLDSTVTVLAAYDENDKLLGSVMNWACHPTFMGADNTEISSDFAGPYYEAMESELGGTHLFVNGAIGASIQPDYGLLEAPTWDYVTEAGQGLAETTQTLITQGIPVDDSDIWLVETREVYALVQNLLFYLASLVDLIPREVPPVGEYGTTYMSTFAIGPVTFGTMPGEYVPDYSFEIRDIMGGQAQVIIGLGMDWIGYAITPQQYGKLAYIYERFLCPSEFAGEELMSVYHDIWDPDN